MPYRVELAPAAARDLDRVPDRVFRVFQEKLRGLANDPRPVKSKPFATRPGHRILRAGDYRAVYHVDDQRQVVELKGVGHRREIYDVISRRPN